MSSVFRGLVLAVVAVMAVLLVLLKKCGLLTGSAPLPKEDDICKICLEAYPATSSRIWLGVCGCIVCREVRLGQRENKFKGKE